MRGVLADAGPMIALLNRSDPDHERAVETLKKISAPLLTTWMPVTEAMHLLAPAPKARDALLEFIARGTLSVLPIGAEDLPGIRTLMAKYADLPMDFADATLVHVAMRERIEDIFTLDRNDFGVYRLGGRKSFNILPL